MMIEQLIARAQWVTGLRFELPSRVRITTGMLATALSLTSVCMAPAALADSTDLLRAAVAAARPAACPLRSNPVVDQAAEEINQTTDRWINNAARAVPETNALTVLRDLGYDGTTASILSGAATAPANAIKATLLQGFDKLPDCSYKDFGVSTLYNAKKDMTLTTVVLAA
ncbi:hypothetical protein [Mycobacterium sp. SA01]|uniref:hypothetical protein n=1 Tax=Mycobacterium sp. SA01 TaxID=3238820 RepID=UPI00351B19ED